MASWSTAAGSGITSRAAAALRWRVLVHFAVMSTITWFIIAWRCICCLVSSVLIVSFIHVLAVSLSVIIVTDSTGWWMIVVVCWSVVVGARSVHTSISTTTGGATSSVVVVGRRTTSGLMMGWWGRSILAESRIPTSPRTTGCIMVVTRSSIAKSIWGRLILLVRISVSSRGAVIATSVGTSHWWSIVRVASSRGASHLWVVSVRVAVVVTATVWRTLLI